jgi:photosystem II stability/assembly factor-like uncharacterized protein
MVQFIPIFFLGFVCMCTAFSQELDWKDLSGNSQDEPVYVVTTNGTILFGQREKGIFRSTDNGHTWLASDSGLASLEVQSVQTGQGQDELLCNTRDGAIYRSVDDGISWQPLSAMPSAGLFLLRTVQGLFYGWSPELGVYRSVDDGMNWARVFTVAFDYDQPSALASDSAGRLFLGTSMNGIYRSTDSGRSWAHVHTATFKCDRFYQASEGLLYAWVNDAIKVSTDHGATWSGAPIAGGATRLMFDGNVCYALRRTGLSRSLDSGKTYQELAKYDANGFWVAPNHGIILWRNSRSISVVPSFGDDEIIVSYWLKQSRSFCASNGGRLYAINFDSQLLESRDGGLSWVAPREYPMIKAVDIVRDEHGAIAALLEQDFTHRFAVKASDTSAWISHIVDSVCGGPTVLCSPSPGVFDFLCANKMFRTRDYGLSWTGVNLLAPEDTVKSYITLFSYGDSGIIVGADQRISSTTNLGRTWYHDPYRRTDRRYAVHVFARNATGTIYCSQGSGITYTTDGGVRWLLPSQSTGSRYSITIDSSGRVLSGGGQTGGWVSLDSPQEKWKSHIDTLRRMPIYAMYTAPDGRIIVGTADRTFSAIGPKPATTASESAPIARKDFTLLAPYPNPFANSVEIPFTLTARKNVAISVYNILGVRIRAIASAEFGPGSHAVHWDGLPQYSGALPPGCYFIKMTVGSEEHTKIVMKSR